VLKKLGEAMGGCLEGLAKVKATMDHNHQLWDHEGALGMGQNQPCSECRGQGVKGRTSDVPQDVKQDECPACCGFKKEPVIGWSAAMEEWKIKERAQNMETISRMEQQERQTSENRDRLDGACQQSLHQTETEAAAGMGRMQKEMAPLSFAVAPSLTATAHGGGSGGVAAQQARDDYYDDSKGKGKGKGERDDYGKGKRDDYDDYDDGKGKGKGK